MADLDPSEHTIDELDDELDEIDDRETLEEIREAETNGEDRDGAKGVIDQRLDAVSEESEDESEPDDTSADGTDATIIDIRNNVRNTAGELIGRALDGIVEIHRTDDGWQTVVELIERRSVPDTQDIIGRYALELDTSGEITGYQRIDRYRRGDTRRDEP